MKWSNVSLIYCRELRDQLRDRRTLFTVLILPLLLYPLMGIAMLQVSQFMREHPTRIWLIGADNLSNSPSLLVDQKINPDLVDPRTRELIELDMSSDDALSPITGDTYELNIESRMFSLSVKVLRKTRGNGNRRRRIERKRRHA